MSRIKSHDHLTQDAIAAETAGMSYGKWKALHPHTEYVEKVRPSVRNQEFSSSREVVCGWCGKKFFVVGRTSRTYCDDLCKKRAAEKRYLEKHPLRIKVCAVCGKEIPMARAGSKYCGNACKESAYRKRTAARKETASV